MTSQPRRRALDPRLLIGVALVVGSVLGVLGVVSAVDRRAPVYAAAVPLNPGDRLDARDLVERRVALDGGEELYLRVGQLPEDGLVVTRPVRAGELVATSALGEARGLDATAIVVALAAPVSGTVAPGSLVDVWTASAADAGVILTPPTVVVADAVVVEVVDDAGLVTVGGAVSVELLVPRSHVARILQAVADGADLSAVPAGLPWVAP